MQKYILLIFWFLPLGDGEFEIEYVLRKEIKTSVKQLFTYFAFVFHLKCYWFYYCGFIILLL